MVQVTYTDKTLPDGHEVFVSGLNATLINGQAVEVNSDAIKQYESRTGRKFNDLLTGKKFKGRKQATKKRRKAKAKPIVAVDETTSEGKEG